MPLRQTESRCAIVFIWAASELAAKACRKGLYDKTVLDAQRQERRMSVEIPSDCTSIVEQLIANGSYRDEAAIVAAGIRLVAAKERLNADIEAGIRQLDAGDPASEVYAKARERTTR